MTSYVIDIESAALLNNNFRQVLYTSPYYQQLIVMSIPPSTETGFESHPQDQFFRIESGTGRVVLAEATYNLGPGIAIVVPAGSQHNLINLSASVPLKLYSVYSPPHVTTQVQAGQTS